MPIKDIDRQNVPVQDRLIPRCVVVDMTGTEVPRYITVELPETPQPRVLARWNGFPNVQPGDKVLVQRQGADGDLRVVNVDGSTPILIDAMKWLGEWSNQPYKLNDVTEDNLWLMVANKDTTDKPSPQPGDVDYQLPDSPSWTNGNVTSGLLVGNRIQVLDGMQQVQRVRIWIPDNSANLDYTLYFQDINNDFYTVLYQWVGTDLEVGWNIISVPNNFIFEGDDVAYILHGINSSATSQFIGDWDHSASNQDVPPGSGESHRRLNRDWIRFNYFDDVGGDRSAELTGASPGTIITSNLGAEYEILAVGITGSYVEYTVDVVTEAPEGLQTFTFTVPTPSGYDFVSLPSYWGTYPNAIVTGRYREDGQTTWTEDDTAYGVDPEVTEYTASDDWDFLAYSGGNLGGGGGVDTFLGLVDTPSNYFGEAGKVAAVNGTEDGIEFVTPSPSSGAYKGRNVIINGDMHTNQMGFISSAGKTGVHSEYFCDIWKWAMNTNSTYGLNLFSGQQINPPNEAFRNSVQVSNTGSGGPAAAGHYMSLEYGIDGYALRKLWNGLDVGEPATFSFWVLVQQPTTFSVSFRNYLFNRSYITEVHIPDAGSPMKKVSIQVPREPWSSSWGQQNELGMHIAFNLIVGSTYRTSQLNQWIDGNILGSSTMVDMVGFQEQFAITGVQFEPGPNNTHYDVLDDTEQLHLVRKQFERISTTTSYKALGVGNFYGGAFVRIPIDMVSKRAIPTISLSSLNDITFLNNQTGATVPSPVSHGFLNVNVDKFDLNLQSAPLGYTNGEAIFAYLFNNGYIDLDARLI